MQVHSNPWGKKKKPLLIFCSLNNTNEKGQCIAGAPGMIFKKMQNIRKHSCTQAARGIQVFCTEFRILTAASMQALRAAGTMTAAQPASLRGLELRPWQMSEKPYRRKPSPSG